MSWINKEETIKRILGEYPEPHYPDWYAEIIRKMPARKEDCERQGIWIFTFGCNRDTYGDKAGTAVEVHAKSYGEARDKMCKKYGDKWAFQYSIEEWEMNKNNPLRCWVMEPIKEVIK